MNRAMFRDIYLFHFHHFLLKRCRNCSMCAGKLFNSLENKY